MSFPANDVASRLATAPSPAQNNHERFTRTGQTKTLWFLVSNYGLYVLLYLFTFPPTIGIQDEVGFINQAVVWSHGSLTGEGAGFSYVGDFAKADGKLVPFRHPGWSLLLLPAVRVSKTLNGIFALCLLVHISLAVAAAMVLRRINVWAGLSVLVLLHPTLALFSRTAMADESAALFLTLAVYALLCRNPHMIFAGLSLGFATAIRLQVVVAFAAVVTWLMFRREYRQGLLFCIGGAMFAVPLAVYNYHLHGHITGYAFAPGYISAQYAPSNLYKDLFALAVIWPLMFPIAMFYRGSGSSLLNLCVGPYFLFLLCYHHRDSGSNTAETLVLNLRLLEPVLPLIIIGYCAAIDTLWKHSEAAVIVRRTPKFALSALAASSLLFVNAEIFRLHNRHLRDLLSAGDAIRQNFPPNAFLIGNGSAAKTVTLLIGESPNYRFAMYGPDNTLGADQLLGHEAEIAGLVWLSRGALEPVPNAVLSEAERLSLKPIPSASPFLHIWKRTDPNRRSGSPR